MDKTTTLPTANLSDTRMDEFWDNLDPGLTQPKPAPRNLDVGLSDLARATGAGGLELVGGIGELARQAANYGRTHGGKEQGDYLENARANMAAKLAPVLDVVGGLGDLAQSGADSLKSGMSADAQEAMSRSLVAETPQGRLELGDGAGDIDVWAMKMAQGVGSLLPTLLSGGVTGVAARATVGRMVTSSMLKKGVSQEVAEAVAAKTVARLATGAATATGVTGSVGAAGVNARDSVLGMSFDALSNSTTFRDAFRRIDGDQQLAHLSDSDKLAMAREETANLASQATMGDAKTWGAAAVGTLMGDTMLFKMLAGKGAGAGVLKGMAKGAAGEGISEALEEGTQQYSVNEALNEVAGANIDPMKGVVSSAVEGGLIGAGVGGATGGVSGLRGERAQPQSGEQDQPVTQEQDLAGQVEPVAADEIITETQQQESPLGPSASQFDELRDVPAYLRQDGTAERFKGFAEDSEVQRALAGEFGQSVQELVAAQMQGGEQGKSFYERVQAGELGADPFAGDKSALQVAAESQRLQLPLKDVIFAGDASARPKGDEVAAPGDLDDRQPDRSLGEQSTRDPRSPVARAIEQAGGEHDSIFGPLKSLRITRKGKPFATEKEAALASRKGQETPVPLNGGGFGVAAIEEVEQAKEAIADNSEEQSHEQIAGVDPVGSKGEGDQQPAGAPVPAVAGAEPDTADALPAPAREHSPAPDAARDESLPDDDALTPAPAGVAVSEEVKSEKAASDPTERIETARAEVALEPSEAQKDAGNYKKGHLTLHGLDIALENPKGSTRTGTDPAGKAWQSTMVHDYGYIKRTQGADGDHVDVFIGDEPDNGTVYVVDQVDPKTGKFDEHKVMMGFASERAAREGYLANYEKGWKGLSAIKAMPMAEFKRWVKEGDTTKPIAVSLNTDGKITDFGEKIGGARKDVWASYRDSIQGDTVDEIKELPLSKVWPTPDYQKLLDSGIQPWFVAYARAARDSIPAKPQIGWKRQRWAEAVKTMRDTALGLLAGDSSSEQLRQQIAKSGLHLAEDISNRAALYEAVGHQRSLADLKLRGGEFSLYNGVKYDPPKQMWTLERGTKSSTLGNWPRIIATGDSKQEAIAAFKARYEELTAEVSKPKAVTFDIYSRNDGKGWFVGKKLGRNYLDLTPAFKDVKEARAYRTANQDELIAKLEQHKAIPRERRDFNQPRVGEDMRAGQDITPEQFASTFGFRGVEFGNWVEQGRRQRDLNDAFDALMDMAAILGIPPKAISLNGELGLAFGARGSGGVSPAAAHYEPGKIVINLTKMNGAGSLGHEWWHALDNYFSRLRGRPGDNMTTALDVSLAARGSNFVHRGEVRKEMVEAFGAVMRAIKQTSLKARSHKLDSRRSKAYWATDVELSARAFESYLIAKLQDQSASNDYLANIVSEAQWEAEAALGLEMDGSYPYATAGEVPAIRAGFDQFFDTLESKQEGDRTILFSKQAQAKGEPPAKHLTRKEAEMVTRGWLKQYRGVDGINIQIHATQAEMERALGLSPVDGLIRRAAFDRTVDAMHVAADTIANPKHLREILRHEVLAHYGLAKVLGGVHYTRLLSRVMGSRNDATMKEVWEWVQTNYADEPIMVQAEEVIAHLAELEPSAWRRGWDRVVSWVTRALRAVGFVSDGVTAAEIRSMIEAMGKQLEKGRGSASSELGSLRFSAERTPWKPGFPEVILHGRLGDATAHPDYEAAKGGDDAAARRLVSDVLTKDAVRRLKELIGDREAIALGVHAEEAVSRNAIPRAMADVLATVLDMDVDLDIVQAAKVGRTAQDGFGRLANQPNFDGPVRTDKPYLIMDDTLTQGGTLANLKGYIEARGGEVLAATALTGKQYSAKIAIDSSTLEQLRDQYDGTGLEAWWQNQFSYGFDSLTESEARYLLRAKDADKIRDRVAAAGQSSPARSEHESARDDGSLPPDGLKFSQSFGADDALQKLNLGRKPDIIDRAHERLDALRGTDRATIKGWVDRFIQKANTEVLDALAPIKYAEDAAGVTDAGESGYVAARMASGAASTMQATMLYGLPEWKDGVIQRKAGTGEADALLGIFEGLGKDLHNWLGWMAGHRAELLMEQGRENLLTAQDIAALKALDKGKEAEFLDAKRRWNALNAATLDLAQEAGLFTAEERAKWESEWYIPFFREGEGGDALAPFKAKGVANQSAGIKKLKGGTAHTADLLENIFTSTSKLIDASMKNMAAQKTVWNLADTGIIEVVAKPNMMDWRALQKGRELITVKLEGEDYLIRVNDPELYRAMTFFDRQPHGKLVQIAAGAKRLLTAGVTASPEFMLRNFLRDSLSSWAISKDGFKPVIDSIKGVKKTLTMDGSTIDVMFSGASFLGGYVNGNDPKAMADSVRKALRRKGMTPEQIERYERSLIRNAKQAREVLGKAWDQYSKYGEAFENANREAVYEAAINNGKSHAQAAFEAKDLMDFSMLGASRVMQTLVMVLPFFNARVQGLGKLARELRDNPRAIAKRAGMITAASLALLAMNWDDERYEELPDWDKDANWHMWLGDQHFRIPKPFEIGVMFGTIPERMVRAMGDKDSGAQFGKAVARAVGETFALNPIPQIVKPMSEAYFNYDPFRGGPIENFADQSVMPEARYSEQTSLLMRELGELTGMSPKKLEHLVVGYTGTLGGYVLSAADSLIRASRPGESAALRADEIPLIKAVYRGSGPAKSTQHMEQFYRMLSEVNELKRTVDQYRKEGMGEEAKALLDEQGGILKARRSLSQTQTQVRQLRNRLELIQRDQTLSSDEKRSRIDAILAKRNDLVYRVVERTKGLWQ
ncbi:LPD38 domain-containing protein [Aeromonas schubertii]|uniref:LPD38 domain-containing protein n=1 Tax=Aeromonas schubertii TaxID=652 RepID=UPI0038B566D9